MNWYLIKKNRWRDPRPSSSPLSQVTNVLFICFAISSSEKCLRISKTESYRLSMCCSSARQSHAFDEDTVKDHYIRTLPSLVLVKKKRHCGLARHFKTDPTKTVAFYFGYTKTPFWRADGKSYEQDIKLLLLGNRLDLPVSLRDPILWSTLRGKRRNSRGERGSSKSPINIFQNP
jgi:hypothetical protein